MNVFEPYLQLIKQETHRKKMQDVLQWILQTFPVLTPKILWNQPMFVLNGTFILGLSASKEHFAVAPEQVVMKLFSKAIADAGYDQSKMLLRIKWTDEIPYDLLKQIITHNITDKANYTTFWRK